MFSGIFLLPERDDVTKEVAAPDEDDHDGW